MLKFAVYKQARRVECVRQATSLQARRFMRQCGMPNRKTKEIIRFCIDHPGGLYNRGGIDALLEC